MREPFNIACSTETGSIGVLHLKRIWSSTMSVRRGGACHRDNEHYLDQMVLDGLGLGLQQTIQYLYSNTPTFDEFEQWIIKVAGRPDRLCIDRLNATIAGHPHTEPVRRWLELVERSEPVLTQSDLSLWAENGYVVLENAVSEVATAKAAKVIWEYVGAVPDSPDSWYQPTNNGIMVDLIQHEDLESNRRSPRIHKAFAQLWETADLWVSADRCGFHPPQRENWPFQGPDLHWDIDLNGPLTFGTQGILYLTDTPPEQGALTLVPGFHLQLSDRLQIPDVASVPSPQDLHAIGSVAIGGKAGDMVIWHHAIPHGSRPNFGKRPRIVQYINLQPARRKAL